MASGTITGSTSNEYIDAKIVWSSVANTSANTSTVTATLYYRRNNTGYTTSGTGTFKLTIDGTTTSNTTYMNIGTGWVAAVSATKTVSHNASGSKSITISASGSMSGTTLSSTSVSGTATLDTIERETTVDSVKCSTKYYTGTFTYKYTPKSATFYHKMRIIMYVNNSWETIRDWTNLGQKPASQQTGTFTLSSSELSKIYNLLPSTALGSLHVSIQTYSDSGYKTSIGADSIGNGNLYIPNDTTTQPTVTMTLSAVSDESALGSLYAKGLSKVKATFTNGAGKYGATIKSYKMTVAGKDYASPYTSDLLTTTGSVTVKGTVTDSRGYSRTYSQTISVLDYTTPTLDSLTCSTSYFNGKLTFKYRPANSVFYSRCVIELNINSTYTQIREILLGQKSAAQQTETVTLTESELSTIYNKFPSGTSGTLRFTFRMYTDSGYSKQIDDTDYKEITLSIPNIDATKPTAIMTLTPVSSLASPFNSLYIKGKTRVTVDLTNRAGKYGATIKSYSVKVGSQSDTPPYTSAYLSTSSAITITGTLTDSRGFSNTYTETITVIDHSAPLLLPVSGESSVIAARCNAEGVVDSNGEYLLLAAKRSYSFNVPGNYCELQFRYRASGESWEGKEWVTFLAGTSTNDEITYKPTGVKLSKTSSYFVQIRAKDTIGDSTSTSLTISSEKVYRHKAGSKNSYALGKYAEEENAFEVAEDWTAIFRGEVRFTGEAWESRALGTNVVASTVNSGRWGGTGVFYRVCAGGKHIYVAFNVSFTTSSSTVRAESQTIPYPPKYDVYALCPVGFSDGSRGIATVSVSPKGRVNIYAVHKLPGATLSTGDTVNWIDGYIDYWT